MIRSLMGLGLLAAALVGRAAAAADDDGADSDATLAQSEWWVVLNGSTDFCTFASDGYSSLCSTASATDVFCSEFELYYNENCAEDFEDTLSDDMALGACCVVVSILALQVVLRELQITRLQGVAGATLVGLITGLLILLATEDPAGTYTFDTSVFFRLMIPFIIFHAGVTIDKTVLRTYAGPVLVFALLGTFVSALLIGLLIWLLSGPFGTQLPFAESLLFGVLISSTDPCMTEAIFSQFGVRDDLALLISGEALLNDGIAVPLFHVVLGFVGTDFTGEGFGIGCLEFLTTFTGSLAIGACGAILVTLLFKAMRLQRVEPAAETCLFLFGALLPYYVADELRWSGIVAVLASSILVDMLCYSAYLSEAAQQQTKYVTECVAMVLELSIFAYVGVFMVITPAMGEVAVGLGFLAVVVAVLTRFASVGVCAGVVNHTGDSDATVDKPSYLVLCYSGMRGALSWALALVVPDYDLVTGQGTAYQGEIVFMTGCVVLFYVLVTGGYLFDFLTQQGVLKSSPAASSSSSSATASKPLKDKIKAVVGAIAANVSDADSPDGGSLTQPGGSKKPAGEKFASLIEEEHKL